MAQATVRIALLGHGGSSTNLGVGALTESSLLLLERAASQAEVALDATMLVTGPPTTDRIAFAPSWLRLEQVAIPAVASWVPSASLKLGRLIRAHDLVVDLCSGDSFASIYGTRGLFRQVLPKVVTLAARRPLVFAPQTFGPFSRSGSLVARAITRFAVAAYCRDAPSLDHVTRSGKSHTPVVADVAFALPPKPGSTQRPVSGALGFNVSGLLYAATPSHRYFVPGYRTFVDDALGTLINAGAAEVHLIPHVVAMGDGSREDDDAVARTLADRHPDVVVPERFATAGEAKSYIAGLDALVTSRMHAAIGAISSGVPAIAVSYSRKFVDTLATVGYPIPVIDLHRSTPAEGVSQLESHLEHIETLRAAAALAQDRSSQLLDRYVDELAQLLSDRAR